jgi:hypothetical protein
MKKPPSSGSPSTSDAVIDAQPVEPSARWWRSSAETCSPSRTREASLESATRSSGWTRSIAREPSSSCSLRPTMAHRAGFTSAKRPSGATAAIADGAPAKPAIIVSWVSRSVAVSLRASKPAATTVEMITSHSPA